MSIAFVTRPPTPGEVEQLRLALSCFCDGSGMVRSQGGTTLPGWREIERVVAEVLGGRAPEDKSVFDVIIPSTTTANTDYGISIKSKELSRPSALADLDTGGRVYMELSNSPAAFWAALHAAKISENDVQQKKTPASKIGHEVLKVVEGWHQEAAKRHASVPPSRTLDLDKSIFLVLSYSKPREAQNREYQWHSFNLAFPAGINWNYRSAKSILGEDPKNPKEVLVDWYPFSGGQLKYYPRGKDACFSSPRFTLAQVPRAISIRERAARNWPDLWKNAGGKSELTDEIIIKELDAVATLATDPRARDVITAAAKELKKISG